MTLVEVLQLRENEEPLDRDQLKVAIEGLVQDIRKWVEGLPFELHEWSILVKHMDERLNLPSITIRFKDDQVTVQPRSFVVGRRPQVEVSSGARAAILEYVGNAGWIYSWEGTHSPPVALTEELFRNDILAGLLR
jgi:hypothetical protein